VPNSADNHEALHAYSLPGIVMYARNALISADPVDSGAQSDLMARMSR
jgi:hypothetical protein